ncbi:MAG: dimethylsulfonioproprionate lyase family protein [Proteobacteria bacterium]|nr:dimethylsulfonioproprionate lyase family protein [Pseudomonadota bacterium]
MATMLAFTACDSDSKVTITCLDGVETLSWQGQDAEMVDQIYEEVVQYLDAYQAALASGMNGCATATATIHSESEDGGKITECIGNYDDVAKMIEHVKVVVENRDAAKKCFDPTMSTVDEAFRGFTPSAAMRDISAVATWLDRPLYETTYTSQEPLQVFLREFAADFLAIAQNAISSTRWKRDVTINGLPHLWASAGWIPFYIDHESAGSDRFRGGYAYAEIMGPWGMLKIDQIDGEDFQGEIGLTNQRAGTFYPSHFHFPQEVYITLTPPSCPDQYQYMLIDERAALVDQASWSPYFISMDPRQEWLFYIEANNLHSFVATDCNGTASKTGLVTAWARTVVRDGQSQTTNICTGAGGEQPQDFTRDTKFSCVVGGS